MRSLTRLFALGLSTFPCVAAAQDVQLFAAPDGAGTTCTLTQPCALETAQAKVRASTSRMTTDIVVRLLDGRQPGGQMTVVRFSAYGATDAASGATVRAEYLDGSPATPLPNGAADNALDGDLNTFAQAQGQWRWRLHMDLGAPQPLHEVDLLMPAAAFATAFHIESSLDSITWENQARVTTVGVGGLVHVPLPAAITTRYLRVVADAPDGPGQTGGQMAIIELSAY